MNAMRQSVRFRRSRENEHANSNVRTNLLGHSSEIPSSHSPIYGDFDYAATDGFAYSNDDHMHGNPSYRRHRPLAKRIMLGSLTIGLFFLLFGPSSTAESKNLYSTTYKSTGETNEARAKQMGYQSNKKKDKNTKGKGTTKKHKNDNRHNDPPHDRHLPDILPRRFQKTVIAKPLPLGDIDELPEHASGFIMYGSSKSRSSNNNSTAPELPPPPPLEKSYSKHSSSKNTTSTTEHVPPPPPPMSSAHFIPHHMYTNLASPQMY